MRAAAALAFLTLSVQAAAATATGEPIDGAPRWNLMVINGGCVAQTGASNIFPDGDTVHVKLMINGRGNLILTAARPEWRLDERHVDFTLTIDDEPPKTMIGAAASVLFLTEIGDAETLARVREASSATWHLPWGDFRAKVEGLGTAFDAVSACQRNIGSPH